MKPLTLVAFLAVLSLPGSLFAHHGRGATYDMKTRVTLKSVCLVRPSPTSVGMGCSPA
jgi:hypothetical protein